MNGFGNGKFGPDNVLTREQLAVVLTKALTSKQHLLLLSKM